MDRLDSLEMRVASLEAAQKRDITHKKDLLDITKSLREALEVQNELHKVLAKRVEGLEMKAALYTPIKGAGL